MCLRVIFGDETELHGGGVGFVAKGYQYID